MRVSGADDSTELPHLASMKENEIKKKKKKILDLYYSIM